MAGTGTLRHQNLIPIGWFPYTPASVLAHPCLKSSHHFSHTNGQGPFSPRISTCRYSTEIGRWAANLRGPRNIVVEGSEIALHSLRGPRRREALQLLEAVCVDSAHRRRSAQLRVRAQLPLDVVGVDGEGGGAGGGLEEAALEDQPAHRLQRVPVLARPHHHRPPVFRVQASALPLPRRVQLGLQTHKLPDRVCRKLSQRL
eukprot:3258070-Rhodomonas_salina.1